MFTTLRRYPPRNVPWCAPFLTLVLFAGAAGGTAANAQEGEEEAAARQEEATAQEGEAAATKREGEDAEELLVDENGLQYRLERMPKEDLGRVEKLEGNRLRTRWGIVIAYDDEDEEAFYIREYVIDYTPEDPNAPPTAEELAAVAESYRFELAEVDRLVFVPFDEGLPRGGQWRQGFDVADMNGDGHLDLVHGPPRGPGGLPVVFLGNGAGVWRVWEAEYPPLAYSYGDVTAADFDGDGRSDLALGNHFRGQIVLLQREPGRFVQGGEGLDFSAADAEAFSSRAVQAADWDGDGRVDLLALGEGPAFGGAGTRMEDLKGSYGLVLYRNLGEGRWERRDSGATPAEGFGDALEIGDFNRDGHPDVVRGTGLAGQQSLLYLGTEELWEIVSLEGLRPHSFVRDVAVGDFDRDGRPEFALSYIAYELDRWRTGIDLFLAREDGSWERRTLFAREGKRNVWALASGDLQGDGRADLVALTDDREALILLGDEDALFVRELGDLLEPIRGCRGYDVRLADVDGDGKDEILAAFAGERKQIFTGTVTGPGCPGGGSLRAWRLDHGDSPRAEPAAESSPAGSNASSP